jgi:hypothetical protein
MSVSAALLQAEHRRSYAEGYLHALQDVLLFGSRPTAIYLDLLQRGRDLPFEAGLRAWKESTRSEHAA